MNGFPDWWPSNPIGSAYDNWRKDMEKWTWVFYLVCILIAVLVLLYVYSRVKK